MTTSSPQATIAAASNAKLTPAAPGWAIVEGSRVLEDLFVDIAKGGDVAELAAGRGREDERAAQRLSQHHRNSAAGTASVAARPRFGMPAHTSRKETGWPRDRTDHGPDPGPARRGGTHVRAGAPEASLPYGLLVPRSSRSRWPSATRWCARWCCPSRSSAWPSSSAARPSGSAWRTTASLLTDPYLWTVIAPVGGLLPGQRRAHDGASGWRVALLMRQMSKPVRLLVQTGLLLAWAMPVVAALTVWQWLFDTQYGVVN